MASNDPFDKTRSSTQFKVVKLRHTWTIHNFSFCCEQTGQCLISPTFSAKRNQWNDKSKWCLELYPNGDDEASRNFVSVHLKLVSSNLNEIQTKFKLGIVNGNGQDDFIHTDNTAVKFVTEESTSWGYSEFVLHTSLITQIPSILLDDKLTIFCEINVRVGVENISQTLKQLRSDLWKELQANKYSEIEYDDPIFKSRSSTHIKIVKFRHTWAINNFSCGWEKNGEKLISPTFSAGKNRWNDKSEWCLWLYPNGEDMASGENVSLYLVLNTSHVSEIQAKFKLGIVNADGEDIEMFEAPYRFNNERSRFGTRTFFPWNVFDNQHYTIGLDDKLIVFCEITATACSNSLEMVTTPKSDLQKDFDFLLKNSELSDITLSAGGKEFRAHKVFLTARSPVFGAMFQHDMEESRKNRIEITDLDEESLYEMLRYIYTGEVHKLDQMAPRLLGVAEKYAMDGLKIACEKALFESLSLENAAEIFILSDTFFATQLKNQVKDFIVAYATEVAITPGFKSMLQTHPNLGVEAFCDLRNSSIVRK